MQCREKSKAILLSSKLVIDTVSIAVVVIFVLFSNKSEGGFGSEEGLRAVSRAAPCWRHIPVGWNFLSWLTK